MEKMDWVGKAITDDRSSKYKRITAGIEAHKRDMQELFIAGESYINIVPFKDDIAIAC